MRTPNTQTNGCKKFFLLCFLFFFAFPKSNAQDEAIAKKAIITDIGNSFYKGNISIAGRSFTANTYGEVSGNFKESDVIKIDGYEITKPPKIFTNVLRITIKPIPKLSNIPTIDISAETKKLKNEIATLKKQLAEENSQHQLRIRLYDNTVADLNKTIADKDETIEKKAKREHYLERTLTINKVHYEEDDNQNKAERDKNRQKINELEQDKIERNKRIRETNLRLEKTKLENDIIQKEKQVFLYFSIIIFLGAISAIVIAYSYRKARKKERESRLKSELYAQELQEKSEALARQAKELHQLNEETTTQKDKLSETSNRLLELLEEMQLQKDDLEKALHKLHKVQESRSRLTAMVAHDLKNPLNVIFAYSQPKNYQANGEEMHTKLSDIFKSAKRIKAYTNDMLEIQKFTKSQIMLSKDAHNIYQTAQAAIDELSPFIDEKCLKVYNQIPKEIFGIYDSNYIERVYENLLTNAIKYTPINGSVFLEAELNTTPSGDSEIKLSVSDTGTGIKEEELDNVFAEFNQAGNAKDFANTGSTGLGLTFCKMVLEAHNHSINVHSELEKGTTFSFTLPESSAQRNSTAPEYVQENEIEDATSLNFDTEILVSLKPIAEKILHTPFYKKTNLQELIDLIPSFGDETTQRWKNEVSDAFDKRNKERFEELIKLAI